MVQTHARHTRLGPTGENSGEEDEEAVSACRLFRAASGPSAAAVLYALRRRERQTTSLRRPRATLRGDRGRRRLRRRGGADGRPTVHGTARRSPELGCQRFFGCGKESVFIAQCSIAKCLRVRFAAAAKTREPCSARVPHPVFLPSSSRREGEQQAGKKAALGAGARAVLVAVCVCAVGGGAGVLLVRGHVRVRACARAHECCARRPSPCFTLLHCA